MYQYNSAYQNPSGSPIRELFKYLSEPGMISFAGGYPASDLFDVEGLRTASSRAFEVPNRCLQYAPTDGLLELKTELVSLMGRRGVDCSPEQMLITTGSQQGFDLLLRVLVGARDVVITEQPAYPATLQALKLQKAEIVTIPVDGNGLNVEMLSSLLASGAIKRPKLLYTVPTFANPSGATLTRERRLALLDLAVKYQFIIVEDDPYGDLRFKGDTVPSILALSTEIEGSQDWVVHFASLSKIIAPGLRVGWTVAPAEITRRCVVAKQTADLCSSPWTQATAAQYLGDGALERHLPRIAEAYRIKGDVLCSALRNQFGNLIAFHQPEGGMFVWARIDDVNASDLLTHAIANKVIFVPGKAFYYDKTDATTLRLSFAGPGVHEIQEGVSRLKRAYDATIDANGTSVQSN